MKNTEKKGRRDIRKTIQRRNFDIRANKKSVSVSSSAVYFILHRHWRL